MDEQQTRTVRTRLLLELHTPVPYSTSAGQSSKIGKDTKNTRKVALNAISDVSNTLPTTLRSAELVQAWTLNSG